MLQGRFRTITHAVVGDDLVAEEGFVLEKGFLGLVQSVVGDKVIVGCEEEATSAAGGIGDGSAGLGPDALDNAFDQSAGA